MHAPVVALHVLLFWHKQTPLQPAPNCPGLHSKTYVTTLDINLQLDM